MDKMRFCHTPELQQAKRNQEDLRGAINASAKVGVYLCQSAWPREIRDANYLVWEMLEKELTRREKEVRDGSSN